MSLLSDFPAGQTAVIELGRGRAPGEIIALPPSDRRYMIIIPPSLLWPRWLRPLVFDSMRVIPPGRAVKMRWTGYRWRLS